MTASAPATAVTCSPIKFSPKMKKQTIHWLQNAFLSSSCASNKSHSDDTLIGGRYLKSPLFPNNRRRGSRSSRQLKRSKKLRHLADNDVELWRSQSSYEVSPVRNSYSAATSAPASPLPLPMPELRVLLRLDDKLAAQKAARVDIPLPSPTVVHHNRKPSSNAGVKEKEKGEALNGDANIDGATSTNPLCRVKVKDTRRNAEHPGVRTSKKSPLIMNGGARTPDTYENTVPSSAPTSPYSSPALSPRRSVGDVFPSYYRTPDKYENNVPSSAPTSPYSSPALSPRRSVGDAFPSYYRTPPSILQVYSAPEMPPSDSALNPGMFCQISSEMTAYNVDNSPVHSPRLSPLPNSRISNALPSPRKLQVETIAARRKGNAQANVHPLPLPPGAAMPSPSPSASPLPSASASPLHSALPLHPSVKTDLMPIKSQWQKGKLIGRGTFGSVYVASNKETGALCAMKEVEILQDDEKSTECIKQLEQEIKVLSHLKHPNIVQYYGSEIVGDRFYIYLEYVHPGSINKFIHDHCGAITESVVRNFTRHILCGLAYLHSKKTIHRDIKGANLLVDAYGVVKLADFGMAKHLTGQVSLLSLKGSPYWLAPELLQATPQMDGSSDLALAVDIWSLGCTIIEMMNGKPPWSEYEGPAAMFKVMKESPPLPENLSAEGKDFLHCCFRRNPAERPSASRLLDHPFIKNPHPPEVLSQSLGEMKETGNVNSLQERLSYKLDQMSISSDIQPGILKVAENSMHETFSPLRLFGDVGTRL